MTELRRLVTGYYDSKKSVALCEELYNLSVTDPRTEEQEKRFKDIIDPCYYSVLPILGIIVRSNFRGVQEDDVDDLISLGSYEYWKILNGKIKPRPYSITAHFNLYYKVGIRAMLKAVYQNKPIIYDFFGNNALPPVGSYNWKKPDQEVFVAELPFIIYDMVLDNIASRFENEEFDVCHYIIRCKIFQNGEVKKHQIRKIGGKISNAQFYEDYVDLALKDAIQELRNTTDIRTLLSDENSALNPIYYKIASQAG
jgi:hypothetical protein